MCCLTYMATRRGSDSSTSSGRKQWDKRSTAYYSQKRSWASTEFEWRTIVKDKYNISRSAYHEMASLCKQMPGHYKLKQQIAKLNSMWNFKPTPNGTVGVQQPFSERLTYCLQCLVCAFIMCRAGFFFSFGGGGKGVPPPPPPKFGTRCSPPQVKSWNKPCREYPFRSMHVLHGKSFREYCIEAVGVISFLNW